MFRIFDTLWFILERLRQHGTLVLWTLIGLSTATTLALSVVLYVDAVNSSLLSSRLNDPPYAFRFRYLGAWEGNIARADVDTATATIDHVFTQTIGYPVAQAVQYLSGGAWNVRLADNQNLGVFTVGMLAGAEPQMRVVSGAWPPVDTSAETVPVLVSETMLFRTGLQVGDQLTATLAGQSVTLEVAALWSALNEADTSWIFPPKFFDEVFLVQPEALWDMLGDLENPIAESAWFLRFDGSAIRTSDVPGLLQRITQGQRQVFNSLPGTRMDLTPEAGLQAFNADVAQLTQQLVVMVLPVAGLVLYFVTLVASMLVSRQQHEDVTLRSRGMSRRAILMIHTLMWLLLAGVAVGLAVIAAPWVVRLVGQTISFLQFDLSSEGLAVVFTVQALTAAVITALIAITSGLFLAWRTTGQTITSVRQDVGRGRSAWWQRIYLDVLLMLPALYVLYTLQQRGGLTTTADDPFSDPLTFLGPTLFSLALTLLFLRVWPWLLRLLARVIALSSDMVLLMALREFTRSLGRYWGTLLLMCFTLSLTGFTASMASTLDRSLEDSINYQVGADSVILTVTDALTEQNQTGDDGQTSLTVIGYNAPPVEDLVGIAGIEQISRVGRYPARLALPGQRLDGVVLGIDRGAMAAVTRFRADYADEPLADLFNRLAGQRNGVLLNTRTVTEQGLLIGQEVTLQVNALGEWYELHVPILGVVEYFPTLNPNDGFFLLMNIDPIFEAVGTLLPHDVWLSLSPGADIAQVERDVRESGFPVLQWRDPETALDIARSSPSRRGVLGFLSVGFVAAITLTLISTVIQSTASFRAQVNQLGSLRAMGLGGGSVALYLVVLQGMIASGGILSGTAIGLGTTLLFLPLLDFSGGLPPYLVRVAWQDIALVYVIFASVLLAITLFITIMLGRESLTTVVKLGDA